jgi:hypothetical protein
VEIQIAVGNREAFSITPPVNRPAQEQGSLEEHMKKYCDIAETISLTLAS